MLRTFLRKGSIRNIRLSQKFFQEKSEKNQLSQQIEKTDEKIKSLEFEQEQIEQGLAFESKSKKDNELLEEYGIGTSTKNVRGLADFFRHPAFWGSTMDVTSSMSGKPWNGSFLKDLTYAQLHEVCSKIKKKTVKFFSFGTSCSVSATLLKPRNMLIGKREKVMMFRLIPNRQLRNLCSILSKK